MPTEYAIYDKTIGAATGSPHQAWGISCLVDCDCLSCPDGQHRVDAFNRGSHQGWYDDLDAATAIVEALNG